MKPPPKYRPGIPRTLDKQFAADPFDPRMHRGGAGREHTPIGLLIEVWHWCRTHDVPPALVPVLNSVEACLRRECPAALAELEQMQ